ncbi:ABC transporter permease [Mesorhizobium sp. AR07]|uniref:ABC transporter permease n=1 Tax=Mesorhizobium sp. AR07 TaxID=2865838 RepID=UPI0021605FA3|nr:ABC transporter permease [Mesorhizobium sp. AR07]UVK43873.1 ABC transporter permease [Mesorhizobium sp. AR07]
MTIFKLVVRRALMSVVTLLIVSLIVFAMLEVLPGDVASRILGRDATPEALALLRTKLGLDHAAPIRYLAWLGGLLSGDLGQSLVSNRPVTSILGQRIFNTVLLSTYALLLYLPLTIIPALLQALNRDKPLDHALSVVTLVLLSLPDFLLATLLLLAFVVMLPLLPAISLVDATSSAWEYIRAMTLPALTLAIVMSVYAVRMLRDNLIEVLDSDYIRMAELKGLSRRRVLLRHALPNALVPTLNITALNLAYLVGGVVVVEKVFSYPGFGSLLVDSLQLRDLPVIEATVMIAAFVYVAANLMADVAAILINPRLRAS